ncbi:MAG: RNA polymerase subunit sigma-70 [Acidobacteria bacterium]|nr:RNA polymerase subunit sigma-70 [Acidobacteriota bacterium]
MDYAVAERLLEEWGRGDRESLDRLMGLVYHELHRMASGVLRGESTTNRTRPTSLVNELYLELQRQGRLETQGQKHFFSIAAFLMRQILVGHARKRNSQKRGSGVAPEALHEVMESGINWQEQPEMVIALNDALAKLEELDPVKASIVDMRFFADLSIEATAEALGMSTTSVKRHWAVARVWLYEQMQGA